MSVSYQALLGDATIDASSITVQELDADLIRTKDIVVSENAILDGQVMIPQGAQPGWIWTCGNNEGVGAWKPDPNTILDGDATGELLKNRIDKLAGGTVLVADLVEEEKEQTLTHKKINDASNEVAANILRTSNWKQELAGEEPTDGQLLTSVDGQLLFQTLNVLARKLIGFIAATDTVNEDDTILQAIEKLSGNANV